MIKYLLAFGLLVLPVFVLADEPEKGGLPLDSYQGEERAAVEQTINCRLIREIAETEGVNTAFEEIQIFKFRNSQKLSQGPNKGSEEPVSNTIVQFSLEDFRTNTLQYGDLFLDTYAGRSQSLIFAVTKDQCRMLVLPGEDAITVLLSQLHALVSKVGSDQDAVTLAASKVSDLLLGDLKEELTIYRNIILAPDGIFNLIPTSMLLSEDENFSFTRIPSASILMDIRASVTGRKHLEKPKILAVGGVVDDGVDLPEVYRNLEKMDNTYNWVTVVRPNSGAGVPDLGKLLGFDLIHVAAQTIGDDRNAWQSAITLDPADPQMIIRAAELSRVKLDTRLVVLANCSSASDGNISGEGIQGITTAFLATGVPAVVATLWPVGDAATGFFMAAFYEELSLESNAAEAMAVARKKCQLDPRFNQPFYWGAFILVGESQVQMPLELKTEFGVSGSWLLGLLAGAGCVFFFFFRARR